MAKKSEFSIVRSFVKHALRGGVKASRSAAEAIVDPRKWVTVVTQILDEMIFEVMDEKSAYEQSKKVHEQFNRILREQAKTADTQETDHAEMLLALHLGSDVHEEIKAGIKKIICLLQDPDKAAIPKWFAAAVEKVLARDEELLEVFLNKLGALSEEHAGLSSEHGVIVVKANEITAAIEGLGVRIDAISEDEGESRKERKVGETRVFLSKLPVTGGELFGRDKELMTLSRAWVSRKTKIISFVAWGGVGKTALVNEWLNRMGEKGWGGAERVYGWSFYSQGTKEEEKDRQANSDAFLLHALEWFGDEETAKGGKSPWNKGVRLAELVQERKTLLILDGVEPLQYPPGPMAGRLKDQGLQGLLRELSHGMDGLCVITTREKIEDLEGQIGHTVRRVELENLTPEAGMEVLKHLGVKTGSKKDFKEAVEEVKGHALALNLLGTFVETVHDGDIRKRDRIEKLAIEEEEKGGHAKHVMEFYERWLREKNKAEVDILYLMGLFDRPAEAGAVEALRKKPVIKGLTGNIVKLSEAKWKFAVKRLRELKLLAVDDGSGDLDCHPLVREHFGEKLRAERPGAWREAHGRLYEYYKDVPEKERPDTLEEMEPLFRAVYHGCAAGRQQKTLDEVYWEKIYRGNEKYSIKQLGAFGSDLGAVACFFEEVWDRPAGGLSEKRKALVLNFAGFALRAVGRLREAVEPFRAAVTSCEKQDNWRECAINANNLSELYLTLGEVGKAVEYGRRMCRVCGKKRGCGRASSGSDNVRRCATSGGESWGGEGAVRGGRGDAAGEAAGVSVSVFGAGVSVLRTTLIPWRV